MKLEEINKKIKEWTDEGKVNGTPTERGIILIAFEIDEKQPDKQDIKGTTAIQPIGNRDYLAQAFSFAIEDPGPLRDIIARAVEIDIEKEGGDK